MIKDLFLKNWKTTILAADALVAAILLGLDWFTPGVAIVCLAIAAITLLVSKDA